MILGIDPGITGALALLDGDECRGVWDMPVSEKTHGKGKEVNAHLLADIVDEAIREAGEDGLQAIIEQVSAMPGQGVSSMFSFGASYGTVRGVLGALGVPYTQVTPQRWKRSQGLTGRDKDASRTLAIQRYPEIRHLLTRKKDNGRADAVLIGAFGVAHG